MKKLRYIICLCLMFLFIPSVSAKNITIHLFYSETCPHCKAEREFLEEYQKEEKDVTVKMYEVSNDDKNAKLLKDVKDTLVCSNGIWPYTVIGEKGLTGYSDSIKSEIKKLVNKYKKEEYYDLVAKVKNNGPIEIKKECTNNNKITLPIIGEVDKTKVSLIPATIIIGFIDGFNPCAMWILVFLISMLIGIENKKKRIGLGIVFLISSGIIYGVFMASWLGIMLSTLKISFIQKIIGLVAIIGALWNLYNYNEMRKKDIGCKVTDDDKKKKMMMKVKESIDKKSFILAAIGLIGLAFSVNLVEFACSAGWPVIFTDLLAIHNLSFLSYFGYILLYIIFYMIDDIVIFVIAMFTLEVTGISNKYNKYSHLIGGILMLLIGILMIFKPSILMLNF